MIDGCGAATRRIAAIAAIPVAAAAPAPAALAANLAGEPIVSARRR